MEEREMTLEEALHQLELDMDMITFNPTTGEVLSLEQVKAYNEHNYKSYLANQIAIQAIMRVIRQRDANLKTDPEVRWYD